MPWVAARLARGCHPRLAPAAAMAGSSAGHQQGREPRPARCAALLPLATPWPLETAVAVGDPCGRVPSSPQLWTSAVDGACTTFLRRQKWWRSAVDGPVALWLDSRQPGGATDPQRRIDGQPPDRRSGSGNGDRAAGSPGAPRSAPRFGCIGCRFRSAAWCPVQRFLRAFSRPSGAPLVSAWRPEASLAPTNGAHGRHPPSGSGGPTRRGRCRGSRNRRRRRRSPPSRQRRDRSPTRRRCRRRLRA